MSVRVAETIAILHIHWFSLPTSYFITIIASLTCVLIYIYKVTILKIQTLTVMIFLSKKVQTRWKYSRRVQKRPTTTGWQKHTIFSRTYNVFKGFCIYSWEAYDYRRFLTKCSKKCFRVGTKTFCGLKCIMWKSGSIKPFTSQIYTSQWVITSYRYVSWFEKKISEQVKTALISHPFFLKGHCYQLFCKPPVLD